MPGSVHRAGALLRNETERAGIGIAGECADRAVGEIGRIEEGVGDRRRGYRTRGRDFREQALATSTRTTDRDNDGGQHPNREDRPD